MKYVFQVAFLFSLTTISLSADIVYSVSVNTSAYVERSGYLDFQLGSGPDSLPALIAIQSFSTDGALNANNTQISGSVTGTLPGVVMLTNSQQFNDYFAGFTYGKLITFALDFSGPAINAPTGAATYGSPFAFGLYDSAQMPIGSSDPFGNALLIQINPNGTTTSNTYNSAVSVTTAVPEPGILGQLGLGFVTTMLTVIAARAAKARGQSRHHRPLT